MLTAIPGVSCLKRRPRYYRSRSSIRRGTDRGRPAVITDMLLEERRARAGQRLNWPDATISVSCSCRNVEISRIASSHRALPTGFAKVIREPSIRIHAAWRTDFKVGLPGLGTGARHLQGNCAATRKEIKAPRGRHRNRRGVPCARGKAQAAAGRSIAVTMTSSGRRRTSIDISLRDDRRHGRGARGS